MASRPRVWADQRFEGTSLVAGTEFKSNLLGNLSNDEHLTVTRIIGDLTIQYLVSTTVGDSLSSVDLGIGVAALAAFNTAGALPNPASETEFPPRGWLYVKTLPVSQTLDGAGGVSIWNAVARFQFDLRAMRKIDKGILFMNVLQTDITVGGAMQMVGRVRSLVLI